jgi:hypothetical protein
MRLMRDGGQGAAGVLHRSGRPPEGVTVFAGTVLPPVWRVTFHGPDSACGVPRFHEKRESPVPHNGGTGLRWNGGQQRPPARIVTSTGLA